MLATIIGMFGMGEEYTCYIMLIMGGELGEWLC